MSKRVVNLDELINDAIKIELGDECPFCKGDKKFVNDSENDIIEHILKEHKPTFAKILGKPIS
jgi:glutaredoxin